jgi:GNAT superfamily N-acetyltransferase
MSVNIRMASLDDIEKLVKVRFDYFASENWEVSPKQHQDIETNLRQYYSTCLNTDFFAAFVEEADVLASAAFLAVSTMPANLSCPTGKKGTVLNVLTYPDYRRKGYASRTMSALISKAKELNLSYIELSASELGKPIYEKLMFIEAAKSRFTEMRLSLV